MAREMLKLRKGDSAIMIKADGSIEMAGVHDKEIVSPEGHISPVILFAAAWARKDQALLVALVNNFKGAVREGFFGEEAQKDLTVAEAAAENKVVPNTEETIDEQLERLNASDAETPEEAMEILNNPPTPTVQPDSPAVVQPKIEVTLTPEEQAKKDEEERRLEAIALAGQDPKVQRQIDALSEGAEVVQKSEQIAGVHQPDLPVEQTMAYQKASPEEQEKMKAEEGQIVGNVNIDEGVHNEDQ